MERLRLRLRPRKPPEKAKPGAAVTAKPLRLARPSAAYRYECLKCRAKGDHPVLCGRCGARAMSLNAVFDEKVAAKFTTGSVHLSVQTKSMLQVLESAKDLLRETTFMPFFDHVLGGGIVRSKSILIAGGPGAGKSTLLMQLLIAFARTDRRVLYISGEEEEEQIANRAMRFTGGKGVQGILEAAPYMDLVSDRRAGAAAGAIITQAPALVIVDSIQEIGDEALETNFGGSKQVENLMRLCTEAAKKVGAAIFFVCQVTKQGDPAGPKRAEHMVDAVLRIEILGVEDAYRLAVEAHGYDADDDQPAMEKLERKFRKEDEFRQIISDKHRFAPANRQAIMKMTDKGLVGV